MATEYIVDIDDFFNGCENQRLLFSLKARLPQFKATLFTIPGRCSREFIEQMQAIDWLDLVPHGWFHSTPRECASWTEQEANEYLDRLEPLGMTKGFKAPGWQISDGTYAALLRRGYWVADQAYNNRRRPRDLKAYILTQPNQLHCHFGHLGGHNDNELALMLPYLLALPVDSDFAFVRDRLQ